MTETETETMPALQETAATPMAATIGAVRSETINQSAGPEPAPSRVSTTRSPLEQAFIDLAQERAVRKARGRNNMTRRGNNIGADHIWTRNHAICTTGAIGDIIMGGPEAARLVAEPFKHFDNLRADLPAILLKVCPWLLNAEYLNLQGTVDLERRGVLAAFQTWLTNRVHYFYHKPDHPEHPANRVKSNIGAVYPEFFATFSPEIVAMNQITEDRAREFWLSVADRVPFQNPPRANHPPVECEVATTASKRTVSVTTGGEV